jgi:RTX calcium-binding nonapeptide repeat (4 copies)
MNGSRMLIVASAVITLFGGALVAGAGAGQRAGQGGVTFRVETNERGLSQAYHVSGTPKRDSFKVTMSNSGRFVLKSQRPLTPISPPPGCQVDNTFQVSCDQGLVKAVSARLKRGRDRFIASSRFRLRLRVLGGRGPDRVRGGNKDDLIKGGSGHDRLLGFRGEDLIFGRHGRDVIEGGAGDDTLRGGRGHDRIEGGPGDDDVRR